jgi:hypothetical protein
MATPLQPEFFLLLGIDLFLVISLLSCLLDKHFPWHLPYLYQAASLAGFGLLIVSKEFMAVLSGYMRFWFSFLYLTAALANIVAVNVYLGVIKRLFNYAKIFMFTVSFPSLAVAMFFLASYSNVASQAMVTFPPVSYETTFIGIVALDALVIGFGTYTFLKPKRWYTVLGAGATITGAAACVVFAPSWGTPVPMFSAIVLAAACTVVLAVSLHSLVRTNGRKLRTKQARMEVKKAI